jgi:hypothetical protein
METKLVDVSQLSSDAAIALLFDIYGIICARKSHFLKLRMAWLGFWRNGNCASRVVNP